MSFEPRPNMIWSSGDGSLREMEEEMEGGTNKHGDFSSSFFRTPVRLDQHRRAAVVSSLPRVFSCRPRSQIARSPPGLRNPFVHPSVRVRPSRRVSAALISGRVCPRYDGKRWKEEEEGGSTGLHHSAVKPSQPANPKIVVFECVGAKSGGRPGAARGGWRRANRYDLNVSAASNSWLTSLACLLVVAAAAVLRRVVPF